MQFSVKDFDLLKLMIMNLVFTTAFERNALASSIDSSVILRVIPVAQALNNTRHIHIILQEFDPRGIGLDCLMPNKPFDIWDKWACSRLKEKKTLRGTTIKLYLRSLESFLKWVKGIRIQAKTKISKKIAN